MKLTRRRVIVLTAILAVAVTAFFLADAFSPSMKDVDRIKINMTRQEVEVILGAPYHDRSIGPSQRTLIWLGSDGFLVVWLDEKNAVRETEKSGYQWFDPWLYRWQSLRHRLLR